MFFFFFILKVSIKIKANFLKLYLYINKVIKLIFSLRSIFILIFNN
jgi:hypothetical protein